MLRWFLGVGLLLLVATALGLGLLAYAMYALLGLLIVSLLLAHSWSHSVTAERFGSGKLLEIGEKFTVGVTVRNRGNLPVPWVIAEDFLPPAYLRQRPPRLKVDGKRLKIAVLWAHGRTRLKYEIVPQMRGFYQLGPMILEGGDLFGLLRRFRVEAPPVFVLVYPKMLPLLGYDLTSRRPIGEIRMTHRLFEDPTRIAGVRQYQPGDPLNRVHWRATARHRELHSKIYEPSTVAGATLLLDFHRAAYHSRGEPYRSELAITTAASLANAVYTLGQQIGLVTNGRDAAERFQAEGFDVARDFGDRGSALRVAMTRKPGDHLAPLIVPTRRGPEQLDLLRETLARVELSDGLDFAELVAETDSHLARDATVIALLPEVKPESALALGSLKRRGWSVLVIVIQLGEETAEPHLRLLVAEGLEYRHLCDEAGITTLCQQQFLR